MPKIAETSRLIIRSWEIADSSNLCHLTRQEGLSEFSIGGYSSFSEEKSKYWIQAELERFKKYCLGKFAVSLKDSGEIIGISGLFHMDVPHEIHIELNYRYPASRRGKGYATEAAKAILDFGFTSLNHRCLEQNL